MPDLGGYAGPVLAAYGVTVVLLVGLVVVSWWRANRVKRDLSDAERNRKGRNG